MVNADQAIGESGSRNNRAAQPLQEIDNTAFTAPRGCRRAAVAAPDGGTCVDKPIRSRRNARAARLRRCVKPCCNLCDSCWVDQQSRVP